VSEKLQSGVETLNERSNKAPTRQSASLKKHARRQDASIVSREPTSDDAVQRVGVQSLGRAFSIIEVVARHRDGIGLADLCRLVELHNSTAFHLAKTLVSLGYIRQEPDTKRYRIGRKMFTLAASALDEIEMIHLATPVLEELSRRTGESAHFCVRAGDAVVVLARTSGSGAFQMTDRVGVVRPAHCTALGKAILASLTPDQLRLYIQRNPLTPSTKRSITEIPDLIREIENVRRTGLAFDDGEFNLEVRCAGVAVRDFTGGVVGAVGISGPIWRLSDDLMQRHTKAVVAAAQGLSEDFGYRAAEGTASLTAAADEATLADR
jgi:IclR family transcriptional regulator, KDG regulon repressor